MTSLDEATRWNEGPALQSPTGASDVRGVSVVALDRQGSAAAGILRGDHRRAPAEVAAAGHDRCIVPLKEAHVLDWLSSAGRSRDELYAMLDDRDRPYYEHRLAA